MKIENEVNKLAKLKIKPLRYTLMELREINYLKRKGKPIPTQLLNKPFEDFELTNQINAKKSNTIKIEEIKEDQKESSNLSSSNNSNVLSKSNNKNQKEKDKDKESGILQLKFCGDDEDNNNNSSEKVKNGNDE